MHLGVPGIRLWETEDGHTKTFVLLSTGVYAPAPLVQWRNRQRVSFTRKRLGVRFPPELPSNERSSVRQSRRLINVRA